jgi:Amt family ammonium transporter
VGGMLGIILLGVFADQTFNPEGVNGLLYSNPSFLYKQTAAVVFSSVWAFAFTYAMLAIINRFTPVRVDASSETMGLDKSLHGERAYEEMDLIAS